MYYLNYLFIFSILGYIIETFVFNKNGTFYGWWTPIFGCGVVIILWINKFLNRFKINDIIKFILTFLSCSIILTILEAICGYLTELILTTTPWDYSHYKFHLGKYIALEVALIWGLSSVLIIYFIKPFLDKIISKIPIYLTYILTVLMIADFIATFVFKH